MKILQICPPHLSNVATLPWEIQKSHFQQYIHTYFWLFMLSHKKTNCNPLAHPAENVTTLTCELFHLTEGLLRSVKCWKLWKKATCGVVVSGSEIKPAVMCGNWNVRQAMAQQVFRVTTFCINTCFQSFSTLISRIITTLRWNSAHVATGRCRKHQHYCPYQ